MKNMKGVLWFSYRNTLCVSHVATSPACDRIKVWQRLSTGNFEAMLTEAYLTKLTKRNTISARRTAKYRVQVLHTSNKAIVLRSRRVHAFRNVKTQIYAIYKKIRPRTKRIVFYASPNPKASMKKLHLPEKQSFSWSIQGKGNCSSSDNDYNETGQNNEAWNEIYHNG